MAALKDKLASQIPVLRNETSAIVQKYGDKIISEVTVAQLFGGMRGIKSLICDTSSVDPDHGLIIRGIPISQLTQKLPEEIFYLLCTGELPDSDSLKTLQAELGKRTKVPEYIWSVLKAMPDDSHPMVMFNTAILIMQRESAFVRRYDKGIKKLDFWEPTLEDALNMIARLPEIAAGVYRIRFKKGKLLSPKAGLDWAAQFAHLLGINDPTGEFAKLMRLYMVLHCDHESGNVSAHASHLVGSALSDAYYSVSAGLNGLAGPLHGLANQECLKFVLEVHEKYKGVPSDEELEKFTWDTLNSGKVVPGYGHAVLRATDPRFTAFLEFGSRVMPDDNIFRIVDRLFHIVPGVLEKQGKAKNPWPNVDAASGALLHHYGLTEFSYYTVLFAVSRVLGLTAQLVIDRALGSPIERPKSVGTAWVKATVEKM